jgi:hypothetical protein
VAEGRDRVRLGIGVTARAHAVSSPTRLAFARTVEALGFDSMWVPDHPMFTTDCWAALAAHAAVTSRVRLRTLVSCNLCHGDWATARSVADIDRLSGGRAVLGIGAGWPASCAVGCSCMRTSRRVVYGSTTHERERSYPAFMPATSSAVDELELPKLRTLLPTSHRPDEPMRRV